MALSSYQQLLTDWTQYQTGGIILSIIGVLPREGTRTMLKLRDFVRTRLYDSEEEVIQDALRHLLRARPDLRIEVALHRYEQEDISLAKAAAIAGVSWAQMKDVVLERGIQPRLGVDSLEEIYNEVHTLRDLFEAQQ